MKEPFQMSHSKEIISNDDELNDADAFTFHNLEISNWSEIIEDVKCEHYNLLNTGDQTS